MRSRPRRAARSRRPSCRSAPPRPSRKRNPVYESSEIKAGRLRRAHRRAPEESVDTQIEVQYFIVARKMVSEQVAAELYHGNCFASRPAVGGGSPGSAKIEEPDNRQGRLGAGASDTRGYLDGELKTFFDRYNDWIYPGLMVVPFLGSGFAGLLELQQGRRPVRRLRSFERLARSIAKGARTQPRRAQALDELQDEIDTIQAGLIQEVEASTLDDTAIMAYSLSIDRAQTAISDRRNALTAQPPRAGVTRPRLRGVSCFRRAVRSGARGRPVFQRQLLSSMVHAKSVALGCRPGPADGGDARYIAFDVHRLDRSRAFAALAQAAHRRGNSVVDDTHSGTTSPLWCLAQASARCCPAPRISGCRTRLASHDPSRARIAGGIIAIELYKRPRRHPRAHRRARLRCRSRSASRSAASAVISAGLDDFTYGTPTTPAGWGHDFGDGIPRHPVQL